MIVKIGIMSFEHMHAFSYARCVNEIEGAKLVGIAQEWNYPTQKVAQSFSTKPFFSYKELLDADIDGVIICSANATHRKLTVMAAKVGKHILCEKPIATTIKDAQIMIDVCDKYNVILQTAFPCRFIAAVRRIKKLIEEGKIGKIVAIKGTNHGKMPGGWFVEKRKSGGGAVIDHTVHVVDLMRWMLGSEVKKVYAEIDRRFYDIKADDCGMLSMEFANGVIATLDPSWSRPYKSFPTWGDVTMEIVGTKGVISLDAFRQKLNFYREEKPGLDYVNWSDDMDKGLIEDFIDTIRNKRKPSISGYDGLKALEVALAAYQSAKIKAPVFI